MGGTVLLNWGYSPPGYLDDPVKIRFLQHTADACNGSIQVKIDAIEYDSDPSLQEHIHKIINGYFLGVQLVTHQSYCLSRPTIIRRDSDGRKSYHIRLEAGTLLLSGNDIEFRVTDAEGNVMSDTRQERIKRKHSFGSMIADYVFNDDCLAVLVQSYDAAVRDPADELVHLYEIRDALSRKFGGENAARLNLGISDSRWSRLGRLCNDATLQQGRHRGRREGALRDASEAELTEARHIAVNLIEAYVRHLGRQNERGSPSMCSAT